MQNGLLKNTLGRTSAILMIIVAAALLSACAKYASGDTMSKPSGGTMSKPSGGGSSY